MAAFPRPPKKVAQPTLYRKLCIMIFVRKVEIHTDCVSSFDAVNDCLLLFWAQLYILVRPIIVLEKSSLNFIQRAQFFSFMETNYDIESPESL